MIAKEQIQKTARQISGRPVSNADSASADALSSYDKVERSTNMHHTLANEETAGESILSGRFRDNCVMINSKASKGVMKD
jgi:hypothetical protein